MLSELRLSLTLGDLLHGLVDRPTATVEQLEQAFADRFGFPFAVLFPQGRVALQALLTVLDRAPRPVLCPAYTCSVVPHAIAAAGYPITFVDSADASFLPGPAEWQQATHASTIAPAMMIVTPLYGYPVDKQGEAVVRGGAPDVFVLYDEAQSYGVADAAGAQARDADGALVSLGLGKMLTALSGGMLLLRDERVWRAVQARRDAQCGVATPASSIKRGVMGLAGWAALREPFFTVTRLVGSLVPALSYDEIALHEPEAQVDPGSPGGRLLPAGFQRDIGLRQLRRLDQVIAQRRELGRLYERRLGEAGFRRFAADAPPTWSRFPLPVSDRPAVVAALSRGGVQAGLFLRYSCAALPSFDGPSRSCPNADRWAKSMINLPNWTGLGAAEVDRIVGLLAALRHENPAALAWPGPDEHRPGTADRGRPVVD